jgi:predicted dehydrogenase
MNILFYGFQHGHIDQLYRLIRGTTELNISACIEEDADAAEAAAKRLGLVINDEGYDAWLQKNVDIVVIGKKYGQRGAAVIKALRAGKHVISDKPLCTSMEELAEIEKIAKNRKLKIGCMFELRDMPSACRVREILESRRLGEICNISFDGQHCIDYAHRPSWYFEEGMQGGTINDLAIHGIDLVRTLTGLEIEKIDGVRTWNRYAVKNPEFKDCAMFMARLTNGAEILADVSYSAPSQVFSMPTYWNFKIWCARGLITFHYCDSTVTVYEDGKDSPQLLSGIMPEKNYLETFLEEIKSGTDEVTGSVIDSTRTALWIQREADERCVKDM